jgi:uncharacterized protein YxeA
MKKGLIIIVIIAVLAALFAWVSIFGTKKDTQINENVEQVSVEGVGTPEGKQFSGIDTLASLQAQGKDLECQVVYEQTGEARPTEGTYFTSKGNLRGDFVVPAPDLGGTIVSSMIVGGSSMYVWSKIGDDTFGFKSDITNDAEIDSNEPVPLDAQVKYTCTEWENVDGSVFIPPADVTFKDLGAVINAGMEYGVMEGEF